MKVWLLEHGAFYTDRGLVVAACQTKKDMLAWVRENYPTYKRVRGEGGIYFKNDAEGMWLRCESSDRCELVLTKGKT